ncbi:MAG: hypothetical protein KDK27_13120, partial [Leptospiraceae bacterium]|nr:hypothetical protein [Leptospiraceae bacterium]
QKGMVFYHAQQYIAAREFFYKALDIQPFFHLARRYLGDAYFYSGEWDGALEQWEFLDEVSGDAYPLVRQRSQMLRFYLNRYRNPGDYVFLRNYTPNTWSEMRFDRPVDTAIDEFNRLYILSYQSANILNIDSAGTPRNEIKGQIWDRLGGPLAMALHNGRLYVADYNADQVRVFTLRGYQQAEFGETGSGDGQFHGPTGIAVNDRFIFVSDSGNRRVQKFDLNGVFLGAFQNTGDSRSMRYPAGIAIAADDMSVYIADREDGQINHYDIDGNFLGALRTAELKKPHGIELHQNRLIVADEDGRILFYNLSERQWSGLAEIRNAEDRAIRLERPFSARMDANGVLYVSDYGANQVYTLVPRGLKISNLDARIQRIDTRNFPTIGVFVSVRNRLGSPVRGLNRNDIFLYENDRRLGGIRANNITPYNRRARIVITKENTDFFREFYDRHVPVTMESLLAPIREADQVQLVRVGEHVREIYSGQERRRMLSLLTEGDTIEQPNLGKGLYESITLLIHEIGPRNVNLLVSGKHYPGAYTQYSLQTIAQYAWANGVTINVISYEAEPDPDLRDRVKRDYRWLAEFTGGHYYPGFDETELAGIFSEIKNNQDERYILTYTSSIDEDLTNRYVDVRIEVQHMGTTGLADAGYFVP